MAAESARTITERAITYARRYPGQSATQIAHAIGAKPSTVSGVLHKACERGDLIRSAVESTEGRCHWHSKGGGGPSGGHVYGPVPS